MDKVIPILARSIVVLALALASAIFTRLAGVFARATFIALLSR